MIAEATAAAVARAAGATAERAGAWDEREEVAAVAVDVDGVAAAGCIAAAGCAGVGDVGVVGSVTAGATI